MEDLSLPTEDAIRALLENLVDPLLPLKPSPSDAPSKDVRESVAKQVHALVLLYNYYHRKENTHLERLAFESFRSLTTVLRPALTPHFKDSSGTSLLEKVIVDACGLSMSLDASSDMSTLKKWPVKKVAVLLVDSNKNCCYLQNSTITQGVWSLLEITVEKAGHDQNEEVIFQKVAFASVKEATGIDHKNIVILERHLVYSLSEDKSAARFYIMKSTSQDNFPGEIVIEDALNFMQGPLFEKSFSEWSTNSKVDYYHLLPYFELIKDWFSRREEGEFEIEKEDEAVCDHMERNGKADAIIESEVFDKPAKKAATSISIPMYKKKVTSKNHSRNLRGRTTAGTKETLETVFAMKAKNAEYEMSPCNGSYLNGEKSGFEVVSDSNDHRERLTLKRKASDEILNRNLKHNAASASASAQNSNLNIEELQTTLFSNATSLLETALKIVLCKRDKLVFQQRNIEDEIAESDNLVKKLQGDPQLQLKIVLECSNNAYPRRILEESPDKSAHQSNKRLKLSEPLPPSLCQKLDEFCLDNNWVLPSYRVSPSDEKDGFEAEVRIKETRFAYTLCGEVKSNAAGARESAAARLLPKLLDNI